jgi:hypothetical protein
MSFRGHALMQQQLIGVDELKPLSLLVVYTVAGGRHSSGAAAICHKRKNDSWIQPSLMAVATASLSRSSALYYTDTMRYFSLAPSVSLVAETVTLQAMMMEAVRTSETSVYCNVTRRLSYSTYNRIWCDKVLEMRLVRKFCV